MRERIAQGLWLESDRFLRTGFQTAGRGQAGNSWESEADKNLLFSVLLNPSRLAEDPHRQFELSVLVSVALRDCIGLILDFTRDRYGTQTALNPAQLTIKWPNDLYYGDKKLAGVLIETGLLNGLISWAIAGVGLNVNQTTFHSDAPNPVSLRQITGQEFDLDELMNRFMLALEEVEQWSQSDLWAYYRAHLYRREGYWPFVEREVTEAPTMNADTATKGQFFARIADILPSGEILLQTREGKEKKYHFKQIRYVL